MSGEAENIDLEQIAATETKGKEPESQQEEVKLTENEQKAFDQGWRPQEEFEGPEDNWKSAKEYIRDGEFLATIKDLNQKVDRQQKDFNDRLDNTNKLHEARRKSEIEKLRLEQRQAVDSSDTDAFDSAQTQIDELEKQQVDEAPAATNEDAVFSTWKAKNTWFDDLSDERGAVAVGVWNAYAQNHPGATNQQALNHVDKRIAEMFPTANNINPRREQPNTTETPTRKAKRGGKGLSMSDLTSTERQEYQMFGSTMFKTEAEFLKAVQDTRAQS